MMKHLLAFLSLFCILASTTARADTEVRDVRLGLQETNVTRFVLETKDKVSYNLFFLDSPRRAVIDLPPLAWNKSLTPSGKGSVKTWRRGQFGSGTRVVLDLNEPVVVSTIIELPPADAQSGSRLVIDLAPAPQTEFASLINKNWGSRQANSFADASPDSGYNNIGQADNAASSPSGMAAAPVNIDMNTAPASIFGIPVPPLPPRKQQAHARIAQDGDSHSVKATTNADTGEGLHAPPLAAYTLPFPPPRDLPSFRVALKNRPVIVLDPGHGGVDPGAISVDGRYEKELTLAVGLKLAEALRRTGRYRVEMTRKSDVFIPLKQRVVIARRLKADLFVSLHADSIGSQRVRGATIYTLSEKASDKEAAALAESENRADILAGLEQVGDDSSLASILATMSYRASLNQAHTFSGHLRTQLDRVIRLHERPLRSAGFAVLKSPDVPSVLIEMGYLSSPTESRQLFSTKRQEDIVSAIAKAAEVYFEKKSPSVANTVAVRQ